MATSSRCACCGGCDFPEGYNSDGETYEAQLIGSDTVTDLAVVKIDATGLTAAEFGSSEDLRVADKVMAIGNPGGHELSSSVTIGYVSALNRAIANNTTGYTMEYIQTDAAINPGNSGGALLNMRGEVIGINSNKIGGSSIEGMGYAIPISTARPIIEDLMERQTRTKYSEEERGYLGISCINVTSDLSDNFSMPQGILWHRFIPKPVRKLPDWCAATLWWRLTA